MPGPNAFSAGLLIHENGSLPGILTGIESGTTKALLVVENDPFWDFPDRERLERAIRKIDLLIVIDHLPSKIARLAHVFIPSSTLFETETGFINQEGRIQFTQPIHPGGIPLHQISDGGHPPRVFRSDIPGSGPRPAYEILDGISAAMAGERKERSRGDLWEWLSRENPTFAVVREGDFSSGSKRLPLKQGDRPFSTDWSSQKYRQPGDSLHLLLVDWTFGTEELSSYSKYSHPAEKTPSLLMHPQDAERLNLRHEERVVLSFDAGPLEVDLRTESKMAPGTAILPRHRQLHWQRIKGITTELPLDRIKKA
jgi:NADH-quinone oxidoreductase subunit G